MGLPLPKPLPSLLLTRPQAQSELFAGALREAGFDGETVISPLIQIEATGAMVDPEGCDAAIFTSRNAVDHAPKLARPAWCVGDKTAEYAKSFGWQAISASGDVDDLVKAILAEAPQGRLMHFRGEHSRGQVASRLTQTGLNAEEHVVYRQLALPLSDAAKTLLSGNNPVIVPLFSPRSAAQFAKGAPAGAKIWGIAMSKAVADEMANLGCERLLISAAPTAKSMQDSILSLIDAA